MASDNITALDDRTHVRKRVSMYLGSPDDPAVPLREIIDNGIDEILNGTADSVWVNVIKHSKYVDNHHTNDYNNDQSEYSDLIEYVVYDNGRGIPIKQSTDLKGNDVTMTELAMGSLRAGSKFDKSSIAVGLHGVGESCFSGENLVRVCDSNNNWSNITFEELYKLMSTEEELYTNCIDSNGNVTKTRIQKCWITKEVTELLELEFDNFKIRCTPDHKFLKSDGEYIEAKDITEDTKLMSQSNDLLMRIKSKSMIKLDTSIPVYDLTVENDSHNFQLGNGIFVHNCSNFTGLHYAKYSKLALHNIEESTEYIKNRFKELKLDEISSSRKGSKAYEEYQHWYYKIEYHIGLKVSEDLIRIDDDELSTLVPTITETLPSTIASFIPDPTIWRSQKCSIPANIKYLKYIRMKEGKDTHFYVNGKESDEELTSFGYDTYVYIQNPEKDTKNDFMSWHISLGISENLEDNIRDFSVNTLSVQQGVHDKMFSLAWKKAFESVFGSVTDNNGRDHSWMGVNVLCILSAAEVAFSSQTKERLSDIPGFSIYVEYPQLIRALQKLIKDNIEVFTQNYNRITEYLKSKDNWSRLSQIKSMLQVAADTGGKNATKFKPFKLKDCPCKDRSQAELYICEGDSAATGLCEARAGKNNIAVLPLRGKPKNTTGMDITEILENNEMYDLINAIGVGVNEYYNLDQINYGKVIIAADSDPDGYSISNLILGTISQNLTFLLDEGMVYVAVPPLYEQGGKKYWVGEENKIDWSKEVQRYKGLGECGAEKLYEFLMNPKTRKLVRVTKANLEYARALLSSSIARRQLMIKEKIVSEDNLDITFTKGDELVSRTDNSYESATNVVGEE